MAWGGGWKGERGSIVEKGSQWMGKESVDFRCIEDRLDIEGTNP
jgi:hypothetical protein